MVESGWTMSKVTQEHLQNLVSRGYMIVAELATCLLLVDPAFPASVGGGGTSWHVQHSTSEDSVCHHIDFSVRYYGAMDWSCII
jgi:hypothetical protein